MSKTTPDDGKDHVAEEGAVLVPEGVLRGIQDIKEGRTVSKEDLDSILKF